MRKLLLTVPLFCVASVVNAQDATSPLRIDPSPVPPSGLAQAAVSSSAAPQPQAQGAPQLLPSAPLADGPLASPSPTVPSIEQIDQMFKETSLGKAADEARLHVQWRELSNRTVDDADLVAARADAEAAKTDLEKRKLLRVYYTMYFDRMHAEAGSAELKSYLEARKTDYLRLLNQPRVRPQP